MRWLLYHNGYNFGQAKTKNDAIKRLEKYTARYLNNPGDFIGNDYIRAGEYEAKREVVK